MNTTVMSPAQAAAALAGGGVCMIDLSKPEVFAAAHAPGAVNFDWERAMDAERHRALRDREVLLAELAELGVTPEREVVTYCQTHHRSSHTFVVLRWLGFERERGYPGAWSDWGNRPDTPIAQ